MVAASTLPTMDTFSVSSSTVGTGFRFFGLDYFPLAADRSVLESAFFRALTSVLNVLSSFIILFS